MLLRSLLTFMNAFSSQHSCEVSTVILIYWMRRLRYTWDHWVSRRQSQDSNPHSLAADSMLLIFILSFFKDPRFFLCQGSLELLIET